MLKFVAILLALLVAGCGPRPVHVIHVKNWHFVPKKDFAIDLRSTEPDLTDEAIDSRYATFLDDIEELQKEQETLVFGLLRKHNLKQVFYEGVIDGEQDEFRNIIEQTKRLKRATENVDAMAAKFAEGSEEHKASISLRKETARLYREGREARLKVGCLGRLMETGQLDEVLPLESKETLDAANPVTTDDQIRFDSVAAKAREAEMARRLVAGGPVAIVVLGGDHDLADALKATGRPFTYERVETAKYTKLAK